MPPSNKPVLITGAATPLGHEVTRTLLAAGREVVALIDETDTESLTAVELEAEGARYALAVGHGRTAIIGRANDADAQFAYDPAMSARHCRVEHDGRAVVVRDLESMNGTLIDGAAAPRALRVGSVIEAGDTDLRVAAIGTARDRAAASLKRRGAIIITDLAAARGCVCAVDCEPPLETAAERQRTLAVRAAVGGGPIAAASSAAVYDGARACHGRRPLIETDFLPREAAPATPWAAREHALSDGRAVVVRLFDVFGGDLNCGAAPAGAAASLVRALARGLPGGAATYEGDASHVSEAATWLCAALDAAETGDRFVVCNGGRGATTRGSELEAAHFSRGAPPSSPPSASRCADVSKLRELLGIAAGGLSVARGVALCVAEEAAARGCVSALARPPSLPRALLRARRRVRRGLAIAEQGPTRRAAHSGRAILPALPADALTAVLAFVDGADLARLRSATKGLIAGADAAAVALCRAKGYSRPDWAAPGAPRLLAAAGAWRHPVTVSRGRDPFAPRVQHATATVGGRVYCYGGLGDDGRPTDALDVLELSADRTVARWLPFATTGDKPDAAENARMTAVELLDGRQYLVVLGDACCHVLDLLSRHWNGYQWPLFGSAHFATMNISGRPHVVSINNSYEAFWVIDAEKLVSGDSTAWALAKVRDGVPFSPREGAAAAVVGGSTLVITGGRTRLFAGEIDETLFLNMAESFTLFYDTFLEKYVVDNERWSNPNGRNDVRRSHHAAVALADGSILVIGGIENGQGVTDAQIIREGQDVVPFDALGEPGHRVAASVARVGDAVVVVGGQGALERRGDVDVLVLPERKEIIAPMAGSGVLSVVAQLQLEVGA